MYHSTHKEVIQSRILLLEKILIDQSLKSLGGWIFLVAIVCATDGGSELWCESQNQFTNTESSPGVTSCFHGDGVRRWPMTLDGDEVGSFSWVVGLHTGWRVGYGLRDHLSCEQHGTIKTRCSIKQAPELMRLCLLRMQGICRFQQDKFKTFNKRELCTPKSSVYVFMCVCLLMGFSGSFVLLTSHVSNAFISNAPNLNIFLQNVLP